MGQEQSQQIFNLKIVDAAEGKKLLDEAETIDNYRSLINNSPIDRKARSNHNYFPMADSQINMAETQKWLDSFIVELANKSEYEWLTNFLYKNSITVYVVFLQFSADGGMPHTRPLNGQRGLICFPGGLRLSELEKKTLIHELIHIIQRFNRSNWLKVYEKFWQMKPYFGKIPKKYENVIRFNPDTISAGIFYIYRNKWVPFIVYDDISNPNIHQTQLKYLNTESQVVWNELPDELVTDPIFGERRITTSMREHPDEMAAWIFSDPSKYNDFDFFPNFK